MAASRGSVLLEWGIGAVGDIAGLFAFKYSIAEILALDAAGEAIPAALLIAAGAGSFALMAAPAMLAVGFFALAAREDQLGDVRNANGAFAYVSPATLALVGPSVVVSAVVDRYVTPVPDWLKGARVAGPFFDWFAGLGDSPILSTIQFDSTVPGLYKDVLGVDVFETQAPASDGQPSGK